MGFRPLFAFENQLVSSYHGETPRRVRFRKNFVLKKTAHVLETECNPNFRYHDLASLFQAISLSDRLRMSLLPEGATDDVFECDMAGVPVDRSNLVLRAVDVFRKK